MTIIARRFRVNRARALIKCLGMNSAEGRTAMAFSSEAPGGSRQASIWEIRASGYDLIRTGKAGWPIATPCGLFLRSLRARHSRVDCSSDPRSR